MRKNYLKNIFLVEREGVTEKWWHRFARILIVRSTIVIFFTSAFFLFPDTYLFKTYSYSYFSFLVSDI